MVRRWPCWLRIDVFGFNGNKRAAVGSALEFLARNGYELVATSYELYQATVSLAGEDVKRDRKLIMAELQLWIAARLKPLK